MARQESGGRASKKKNWMRERKQPRGHHIFYIASCEKTAHKQAHTHAYKECVEYFSLRYGPPWNCQFALENSEWDGNLIKIFNATAPFFFERFEFEPTFAATAISPILCLRKRSWTPTSSSLCVNRWCYIFLHAEPFFSTASAMQHFYRQK